MRRWTAVLLPAIFGCIVAYWGAKRAYGIGIFMALPMVTGMLAAMIHGWTGTATIRGSVWIAIGSLLATGVGMIAVAFEGAICLSMAAPLAIGMAVLGGLLGHLLISIWRKPVKARVMLCLVMMIPPGTIEIERWIDLPSPVFAVTTELDIPAPPEMVWDAIIAPSRLSQPDGLPFRLGIAHPRGAWIEGSGPRATRYCDFSTGRLIEPVLVWKRPEILRFSVTQNPQPMRETSPYGEIHPRHLEGFLVSRQGQFRLMPIQGGTRLQATTWYQHHLWPAEYWRWWSDAIIHRIHDMVLDHVKREVRN